MEIFKEVERTYKGHQLLIRNLGYATEVAIKFENSGLNNNWWCGYVELDPCSEFYFKDYNEIPICCHGGLTFKGTIHDRMYIGFDCNHWGDNPIIHDETYCIKECTNIIDQLIEMEYENGGK